MPKALFSRPDDSPPLIWSASPIQPLAGWVDRIWGMDLRSDAPSALPRLLPGTGAEIFIHLAEPFRQVVGNGKEVMLPEAYLLALRHQSINLAPARDVHFIAIRFKAGCASLFLRCPLAECLDCPAPLEELMGPAASSLVDTLRESRTRQERIGLIEDFLLHRLGDPACFDDRVALATRQLYYRPSGVQALADRLGLGRRQLERRFNSQEGLSPVAFRQLARFQRTAKTLRLDPGLSLAQTGIDFGFADQAHMTREFRAIAGQTPEQLRSEMLGRLTFYSPSRPPSPASQRSCQ